MEWKKGQAGRCQIKMKIRENSDFGMRIWPPQTCPRPFFLPHPAGMDFRLRGGGFVNVKVNVNEGVTLCARMRMLTKEALGLKD